MASIPSRGAAGKPLARDQPVEFTSCGRSVVGTLHQPAGERREPGVVFCNAFADERRSSCLAMARLGRALAHRGWPVLRFDYWGCGESPGEFVDATVSTCMEDVRSAVQCLRGRTGCGSVCLLGLRLGAAIAVRAGEHLSECTALALLEPVPDGASYLATLLRHRQVRRMITTGCAEAQKGLEADEIVDLDGYAVRRGTLAEIQTLRITGGHVGFRGRVLVVQVSFTDRLRPETLAVRDTFEGVGAAVDVRALVMPPFWSRIDIVDTAPLEDAVASWFGTLAEGQA